MHVVFDSLGFESWDESYSVLSTIETSILIGYGGNLQTLNNDVPTRSVVFPIVKLFARNAAIGCKKSTNFYYITRDDKTFEPDVKDLFKLCEEQKVSVRIKKVIDGLDGVQGAHSHWTRLTGMGSVVVKVARVR